MKKLSILAVTLVLATLLAAFNSVPSPIKYSVDIKSSSVKWTGYHLAKSYEHWGNISITSGNVQVENGDLVSAEVVIDMNSITNGDLTDKKDNAKLVKDLKSKRFFYASEYPEAKVKTTKVSKSGSGYNVTADVTIRGITKEISFVAKKTGGDGNGVKYVAKLEIDRTLHKVMYGWTIENAILSNNFDLEVELVASK